MAAHHDLVLDALDLNGLRFRLHQRHKSARCALRI
jgi:hypothetical protein